MTTWLYDLSYDRLKEEINEINLPAYMPDQIFQWLYEKNSENISDWSNISKQNREILAKKYDTKLNKIMKITGDNRGTRKLLVELKDGSKIEAVLIEEKKHTTLCVSTQVGCACRCKFCATGRMGFKRNLTAGEILSQVLLLKKEAAAGRPAGAPGSKINIVFMGMGEPLLNYENLEKAMAIITSGKGIGVSPRNITVSTAGILAGIKRLEKNFPGIKVSFSLNAPDPQLRAELMPLSKKENPVEILSYFRDHPRKHRITFEYVLLKGVNDSLAAAAKVAHLLRGIPCKINLIPYNEIEHSAYESPCREHVDAFCDYLHNRNYTVITRWSKGRDIESACGQLATEI